MHEAFLRIAGAAARPAEEGRPDGIHRFSREQWTGALHRTRQAGSTWAGFVALANAHEEDFDTMDVNGGGFVDLQEFCEWCEAAEKRAGTARGVELGVNEQIDQPGGAPRRWHTTPLELHPGSARVGSCTSGGA